MKSSYDIVVVGAGIVGLATAMRLLHRQPGLSLLVVDKEHRVGSHQTGHNSGVIHRGIYYRPGSLKAKLCVEGAQRLTEFCDAHGLPYRLVGKLIIAANDGEVSALRELERRGIANGVPGLRWLESDEIRQIEPHARGRAALHSPLTGIVNFRQVAEAYAEEVRRAGGKILLGSRVTSVTRSRNRVTVRTASRTIDCAQAITCAGLHSDRIGSAWRSDSDRSQPVIVPFRGDYHVLDPAQGQLVHGLIYPVPDPRFPFLGVHFTRRMDGSVWVGPNAVLSLSREGYRPWSVSIRDAVATLGYPGFWRVARRYWRAGAAEVWRSLSKRAFAEALQHYVPTVDASRFRGRRSGIRAQAVSPDGTLVDDFVIDGDERVIHVRNAPSPGATSSLEIGDFIADRALRRP